MFHLIGYEQNVRNIILLSKKYAEKPIESQEDLKKAYEAFLRSYQPHVLNRAIEQQLFVEDDQTEQILIRSAF